MLSGSVIRFGSMPNLMRNHFHLLLEVSEIPNGLDHAIITDWIGRYLMSCTALWWNGWGVEVERTR
jgi:hypothetical protein